MFIARAWQTWRTALIIVLALLLGVRGSVADGYMLDRDSEDGTVVIRICGGIGDRFMALDPLTGDLHPVDGPRDGAPADPHSDDDAGSCPFAMSSLADMPVSPADVALALFGPPLLSARPVVSLLIATPFGPALPARGPPALA